MRNIRPISDGTILIVCCSIGIISLICSLFCLIFARKLQPTCSRGVFAILFLLQILYTLHNFHFAVIFIPFLYVEVGGGYCIGMLCEPHYASFATNLLILLFLTGYLRSLFFLLVFIRHQRLLDSSSRLKLGTAGRNVVAFLIIAGGNILPLKYMRVQFSATQFSINQTIESFPLSHVWIEDNRNFGVFPKEDGDMLKHIIATVSTLYSAFAIACSVHIFRIIYKHNQLKSTWTWSTTIRQTRQSMILVANFVAFITVPIALLSSLAIFQFEDGKFCGSAPVHLSVFAKLDLPFTSDTGPLASRQSAPWSTVKQRTCV